jgi:hypothetical protein
VVNPAQVTQLSLRQITFLEATQRLPNHQRPVAQQQPLAAAGVFRNRRGGELGEHFGFGNAKSYPRGEIEIAKTSEELGSSINHYNSAKT